MPRWVNLNTEEAWNIVANTEDKREKIQALSLAKECYGMKLELLTNASVVDDAIKFALEYNQQYQQNKKNEEEKPHNKDGVAADVIDSNGDRGTKDIIINYNIKTRNQVFYVLSLPLLIFLPVQDFNHVSKLLITIRVQ